MVRQNNGTPGLTMKNTLNIKTLARGMRAEDKAKLLFADRNKRSETSGKEGLLTPEEEDALIKDAQELHQINELNRLSRLYNIASLIFLDIQSACLYFRIAEGRLVTILTGMILVGESSDTLGQAIYDQALHGYTEKQLEEKKYQDEIDLKAAKLRKKYGGNGLSAVYDYFEPSLRGGSYFSAKRKVEVSQPNKLLQKAFIQTIKEVKRFNKQVFQWNYIESKAGIDLLSDRERKIISGFQKDINDFVNLGGYLGFIQIYVEFEDKKILKFEKLEEPEFTSVIKDMKKATDFSKKTRNRAREEVENIIQRKQ